MEESILTSIKGMIGPLDDVFDTDLIIHINSVFMILTQLGVGPKEGFFIEDDSTTWNEFIPDLLKFQAVKTYMYLKTKMVFDPPNSSVMKDSMLKNIDELEWRLNAEADY